MKNLVNKVNQSQDCDDVGLLVKKRAKMAKGAFAGQ